MVQLELNNIYVNIGAHKDSETCGQKHCKIQNFISWVNTIIQCCYYSEYLR